MAGLDVALFSRLSVKINDQFNLSFDGGFRNRKIKSLGKLVLLLLLGNVLALCNASATKSSKFLLGIGSCVLSETVGCARAQRRVGIVIIPCKFRMRLFPKTKIAG